jgi:hypothetical protein
MIVDPQSQCPVPCIAPDRRRRAAADRVRVDGGENGRFNVAVFVLQRDLGNPPLLGISINLRKGEPKDTLRHIRETGDVVNVVDEALNERGAGVGRLPIDVDESQLTGLTAVPSSRVPFAASRRVAGPSRVPAPSRSELGRPCSSGEVLLATFVRTLTDGRVTS